MTFQSGLSGVMVIPYRGDLMGATAFGSVRIIANVIY